MYTCSVSSVSNPAGRQFPVRPQVVAFAGSRRGSLPEPVTTTLVHAFYAQDLTFLTGCATGIDGCFRQAIAKRPFEQRSMVACAFESRARRFGSRGLAAFAVVPDGLSPAAALHRRTVWMVRSCFPQIRSLAVGAKVQPSRSAQRSTISSRYSPLLPQHHDHRRCTGSSRPRCSVWFQVFG